MPKKAQRRPAKTKARPRRPAPRSNGAVPAAVTEAPGPAASAVATAPPPPAAVRASARRAAAAAPTTIVNYAYLRRDLTALAVLAPTMIVLVVVAFLVLH